MTKSLTPCMNCTKRHLACHDKCVDYKEFKNGLDNRKKERDNNNIMTLGNVRVSTRSC